MILFQGLLRSPASWAKVGRGYLQSFSKLGIEAAALSPRGFLFDATFPLCDSIDELDPVDLRSLPEPELGLGFLHPPLVNRLLGRRKVNLFVWEADRVPEAWCESLAKGCDLVVVPSEFTRGALVASGLSSDQVEVSPYGHLPPERARRRRSTRRPFTYLSVLAPHYRKGVTELLSAYRAAFTRSDEVLLRIKTTYDPEQSRRRQSFEIPSWETALRDADLLSEQAPRVDLEVARVDDPSMARLHEDADVCVQPSWGESFGLAVLEAAAASLPVITTNWSAPPEYLPGGEDLLPYRLEEGGDRLYTASPGARVAIPETDALRERLRWHFEHQEASWELGQSLGKCVAPMTWESATRQLIRVMGEPA